MTNVDAWATLSQEWRSDTGHLAVDRLARRVQRQTRRIFAQLAGEVTLTGGAAWLLWSALARAPGAETWLVGVVLVLMTVAVWSIRIRALRGVLFPTSHSVSAYRVLERERLARRVGEARAAARLVLALLPAAVLLLVVRLASHGLLSARTLIPLAAVLYLGAWVRWSRATARRSQAELAVWDSTSGDDPSGEVADDPNR